MVINSRIQNTFMKRYKALGQKRIVNQKKNKFKEELSQGIMEVDFILTGWCLPANRDSLGGSVGVGNILMLRSVRRQSLPSIINRKNLPCTSELHDPACRDIVHGERWTTKSGWVEGILQTCAWISKLVGRGHCFSKTVLTCLAWGTSKGGWEGCWLHSVVITVRTEKCILNMKSVPSQHFFLLTAGRFTAGCSPGPTQYPKNSPCNLLLWYTPTVSWVLMWTPQRGNIQCTAKKWLIICVGYT